MIIANMGRSVPKLLTGMMGVTAVLSMWLSNTATAATMLALCLLILNSLPPGDAYRESIVLSSARVLDALFHRNAVVPEADADSEKVLSNNKLASTRNERESDASARDVTEVIMKPVSSLADASGYH